MQGIEGITARIAQIQTHMASLTQFAPASGTSTAPGAGFAAALADAVASTKAATTSGPAAVNTDGVPVSLAAYGNGKIPEQALSRIGNTGHRLWAPAAQALESMIEAARRDGVSPIRPPPREAASLRPGGSPGSCE